MNRRRVRQSPSPTSGGGLPALAAIAVAVALACCATPPAKGPEAPPEKVRASLQPDGLTPALAVTAARVQTGA